METITQAEFETALYKTENPILNRKDGFIGFFNHKDTKTIEFWFQVDTEEFEYVYKFIESDDTIIYMGSR